MKISFSLNGLTIARLKRYAKFCGQALARSHAKSGNAAMISGYLGKSDAFDEAVSLFSVKYAKQNKKDYKKLLSAVRKGSIKVISETGS
jgi:thiamine monophosphate kinase